MYLNFDNVKAGCLIRCTVLKDTSGMKAGEQFNATILPCQSVVGEGVVFLYACAPNGLHTLIPGPAFSCDNRPKSRFQIDELWGPALPNYAMKNETTGRKLLWSRVKRMTLQEVEQALGYKIKIVDGLEEPKKKRPFGKSNLEPGMVLEDRAGTRWLVAPSEEGLLLVSGLISTYLSSYTDDLAIGSSYLGKSGTELDIVRVWSRIKTRGSVFDAFTTNTDNRWIIWQRDERRPMTREEIEKALGYPVVIVTNANK